MCHSIAMRLNVTWLGWNYGIESYISKITSGQLMEHTDSNWSLISRLRRLPYQIWTVVCHTPTKSIRDPSDQGRFFRQRALERWILQWRAWQGDHCWFPLCEGLWTLLDPLASIPRGRIRDHPVKNGKERIKRRPQHMPNGMKTSTYRHIVLPEPRQSSFCLGVRRPAFSNWGQFA